MERPKCFVTSVFKHPCIVIFLLAGQILPFMVILASSETFVVFESKRSWNYDIYLLDPTTGEEKRLTDHPAYDGQPSWSPDGQRIAFVSERDGDKEIYVMDRDGSNQQRLTNSPGVDFRTGIDRDPSWSPDGSKIAFVSSRDRQSEIYTVNVDGTNLKNLTNSPTWDNEPDWSPDGSMIAFISHFNGISGIYAMKADGTGVHLLSKEPDGTERYPAWSPDGQKVVFVSYRCCGGWPSLFIQEIETGRVKHIPVPFNLPQYPTWTSDGNGIIFNNNQPDSQLYFIDLITGETRQVVDDPMPGYNGHPDWFNGNFHAVAAKDKLPSTWAGIKSQMKR